MNKTIFLFFILSLVMSSLVAQKGDHIIELTLEHSIDLSDFHISEVIDNRIVKENVGFVQKGVSNKRIPAILPEKFEPYLSSFLNQLMPSQSGESLVLIVHEFNVSEVTKAMSEVGTFRYQFEFAKKKNDQLFAIWYTDGFIEEQIFDVTKTHSNRVIKGFRKAISEFSRSGWAQVDGELIELEMSESFDYRKKCKKGLYSSFAKLARNEPFMEEGYTLKKVGKRYPTYNIVNEDGKKIKRRVMFASDGNDIYLLASRYSYTSHLVKSKFIGKYIYYEDKFSDPRATIMFSLLGSALSYTPQGVVLDTATGFVHILYDHESTEKFLKQYPVALAEYWKSEKKISDIHDAIKLINEKVYDEQVDE